MDNCYAGEHITGDHIHTDITKCGTEDHNRNATFERSLKDYWGRGGGLKIFIFYIVFLPFIYLRLIAEMAACNSFARIVRLRNYKYKEVGL